MNPSKWGNILTFLKKSSVTCNHWEGEMRIPQEVPVEYPKQFRLWLYIYSRTSLVRTRLIRKYVYTIQNLFPTICFQLILLLRIIRTKLVFVLTRLYLSRPRTLYYICIASILQWDRSQIRNYIIQHITLC